MRKKALKNFCTRFVFYTLIFVAIGLFSFYGYSKDLRANESDEESIADSALQYYSQGFSQSNEGLFEEATISFIKALNKYRDMTETEASEIAGVYSNLGVVNRVLLRRREAVKYYDSAQVILEENYGSDHINLGAVYQNQGNILRQERDFSTALQHYQRALAIFEAHEENPNWLASLYNNIGLLYSEQGEQKKAIDYYERSLRIREKHSPSAIRVPAGNLAVSHYYMENAEESARYFDMAIESTIERRGEMWGGLANNYLNYGLLHANVTLDYERAMKLYEKALEVASHNFGERSPIKSRILMNIGGVYEELDQLHTAAGMYQQSLIAVSTDYKSGYWGDNPEREDVISEAYFYETLSRKANVLKLLGEKEDNSRYLQYSIEAYDKAIEVLEYLRMGYQTEESRLELSQSETDIYPRAMNAAKQLYRKSGNPDHLEKGFNFSERNKAAVLLASMRNIEALEFGGVPKSLREEEENLKRTLTAYRELVYEERQKTKPNEQRIANWEKRIFELNGQIQSLEEQLEEEYPEYFNLKYDPRITCISTVKSHLSKDEVLLSYSTGDSAVHIFLIDKKGAQWENVEFSYNLEETVQDFLDIMNFSSVSTDARASFKKFNETSYRLYKTLIEPFQSRIKNKKLIIIPSSVLSYFPYELLTTENNEQGEPNYATLPYLLREHPLSYAYSATIWTETLGHGTESASDMIAFAPMYEGMDNEDSPDEVNRYRLARQTLTPLPGAREEAQMAADIFGGKALLDEDACNTNFKSNAPHYRFIHLAMHTIIDDENPMFSKLAFSDTGESEAEDGLLNTYEIYNLRLNARLAVLSSCNSGYGKLLKGEGIMSLARGFLYAGVPSIVMTLWEIEDKSGVGIMENFYSHIRNGKRTDEALRHARLEFLDNADMLRAHPYFWGGYVCIGNPRSAVKSPYLSRGVIGGIGALIAVGVLVYTLRRRRK